MDATAQVVTSCGSDEVGGSRWDCGTEADSDGAQSYILSMLRCIQDSVLIRLKRRKQEVVVAKVTVETRDLRLARHAPSRLSTFLERILNKSRDLAWRPGSMRIMPHVLGTEQPR